MNRRTFFSLLGIGAASAALDPERLLWVPGAKTISIPAPRTIWRPYQHSGRVIFDVVGMDGFRTGKSLFFLQTKAPDGAHSMLGVESAAPLPSDLLRIIREAQGKRPVECKAWIAEMGLSPQGVAV